MRREGRKESRGGGKPPTEALRGQSRGWQVWSQLSASILFPVTQRPPLWLWAAASALPLPEPHLKWNLHPSKTLQWFPTVIGPNSSCSFPILPLATRVPWLHHWDLAEPECWGLPITSKPLLDCILLLEGSSYC